MKKILALVLSILMLVSMLSACGKPAEEQATNQPAQQEAAAENNAPADAEEEKEPVTLTCWSFADYTADAWAAFAEEVHAAYPWITLEWEILPVDSGPEKFAIACATGTTPDIYIDGFSRISPAVDAGLCVDLTDVVNDNADVFLSVPRDGVKDGKNYYIPTSGDYGYGLTVNMTLAKELGVDHLLPKDCLTWSYEDFLALGRAVKAADPSKYLLPLYAGSQSSDAWYYSWFLGNGVDICNADHTATSFNTDAEREQALQVMNLFGTLIEEELVPPGSATTIDADFLDFFQANTCLMIPNSIGAALPLYQQMVDGALREFEMNHYAIPTYEGKEVPQCAFWGTTGICAFNNNGNEETIKLVIDYYLSSESTTYQKLLDAGSGRTLTEAKGTIQFPTEDVAEQMNRAIEYSSQYASVGFGIMEPWWSEFRQGLYPQLQDFYTGKIDAQTVLDNWQAFGDNVISSYEAS